MAEPRVTRDKPFVMKVDPGTYTRCSCKHSENTRFVMDPMQICNPIS